MEQKALVVGLLVFFALLLILQAIFYKRIGVWHAQAVRRYPRFLRWFYIVFPPDSEFMASMALINAVVFGFLCLGFALIIALYMQPVGR